MDAASGTGGRGVVVRGEPPSPLHLLSGCRFHPRCPAAAAVCGEDAPPVARRGGRRAVCHFAWQDDRLTAVARPSLPGTED
ncbi:oligopeptide/dipeptide ABC transporter ATP-binding protein [Sphaerisporangium fuscum]|uniref:oligopeptide/dipeptide ABC transporter ATP-binding protein n=1 Tax=Sphaerisporangium fuscum TaxID=2835868 RepID=UPI0020299F39|nr:oligopeptide/dipeptide ABC transporter ATP-binding protein [Sphaerisporangium fuscum]